MTRLARFETRVRAPHDTVVAFFGDVRNLPDISPPYPILSVLSDTTRVVAGAEFRIELDFLCFRQQWLTRVEEVAPDGSFVDTFSAGVFRGWRHTHRFVPEGAGTVIVDEVEYDPVPWFRMFAPITVRVMFAVRRRALQRRLS